MNNVRVVTFALAVASLSIVIACSGTASTPEDGTANDPTKPAPTATGTAPPSAPSASPSSGSSGGTSSSSSGGPADAGADSASATCLQACAASNPQGLQEFSAILTPCACAASVCGSVCTVCAAPGGASAQDLLASASPQCRACVQNSLSNGAACNLEEKQKCPRQSHCPGFAICAQQCL